MNKIFKIAKVIILIGIVTWGASAPDLLRILSTIPTLIFFLVIFICPKKISYIVFLAAFGLHILSIIDSIMRSRFNDEYGFYIIIFILLVIILITRLIIDFFDKRREKLLSNHNNK